MGFGKLSLGNSRIQKPKIVNKTKIYREKDMNAIRLKFYREYDPGKGFHLLGTMDDSSSRTQTFLGQGTHFRSYRYGQEQGFPLVISIAKPEFRQNLPVQIQCWQQSLNVLKKQQLPLIPPFEVVTNTNKIGYVMPYFPDTLDNCAMHWQPLKEICAEVRIGMEMVGLFFDDYWQLGVLEGIPYIYDLSDLKFSN